MSARPPANQPRPGERNFDGPQQDYQIQSNDQLLNASDFEQVIIAYHNGSPVKLSDVATVENDVENNRQPPG